MKITRRSDGSSDILFSIQRDGNKSPYIEWEQVDGIYKRAWIQRKGDTGKNWANADRYLNVVRCNSPGHPGGNPTDFPIFNDLPDEQILIAFVQSVNAITGLSLAFAHTNPDSEDED